MEELNPTSMEVLKITKVLGSFLKNYPVNSLKISFFLTIVKFDMITQPLDIN
jgi:hypothetical protein